MTDSSRLSSSTEYYNTNTKILSVIALTFTAFFTAGLAYMIFDSIINKVDPDAIIVGNCSCGLANSENGDEAFEDFEASLNEFPWQLGILQTLSQRIVCGGALLSDRYAITTGSCLEVIRNQTIAEREYLIKVVLGEHIVEDNQIHQTQWFWIADVYFHPDYELETREFDIGIIKLSSEVTFSDYVSPICLPVYNGIKSDYFGEFGIYSGWATINPKIREVETLGLQKERLEIVKNQECPTMLDGITWSPNKICVKNSACRGDLGGPLIIRKKSWYELIGLASFANPDDCLYVGFSKITPETMLWIKEVVIGTTICPDKETLKDIQLRRQKELEENQK